MLEQMAFTVDEDGDSLITLKHDGYGIGLTMNISVSGNLAEWDTLMLDAFGEDFNLLMERARQDFHRVRKSVSNNAQLEAYGLPVEVPDDDSIEA